MKNIMIKGTSVNIINSWLSTIIESTANSDKDKHFELNPDTTIILKILKDIFPDLITIFEPSKDATNRKEIKDCCTSILKDQLEVIKRIIAPFIEEPKKP